MNIVKTIIFTIVSILFLVSCEDISKPTEKPGSYPSEIIGAWSWPCLLNTETSFSATPLYRQKKRIYQADMSYIYEITFYNDINCLINPIAKRVLSGTYNIVDVKLEHETLPAPYAEINYDITDVRYEGDKLLAVSIANDRLKSQLIRFYDIVIVYPDAGQLHIGWDGKYEENILLRPNKFTEILLQSTVQQPEYPPARIFNTASIADLAGKWAENCFYEGIYANSDYYTTWIFEINNTISPATYKTTNALYNNFSCTEAPVSSYTYSGTIKINSSIGDNGISQTNLDGVYGLSVIISLGLVVSNVSPTAPALLTRYAMPPTSYNIMVSDPQSDYIFFRFGWSPVVTNTINWISSRAPVSAM